MRRKQSMHLASQSFGAPREAMEGARSIKRAIAILRSLASGGRALSVSEVARAAGLHRATAHRILRVLVEEVLVEQDPQSRRYQLGSEIFALGAAIGARRDLKAIARPSMERLWEETEDTVYLTIRSGYDGLCLDMLEGSFPEQTLKLSVGDRWPLGVGASNMPLLAFLPDAEVADIITHNAPRLKDYAEYAPDRLLALVAETRAQGFAVKISYWYPTMCGVGVPIVNRSGRPIAALSITATLSRMPAERRALLAALLRREAAIVAQRWDEARSAVADRESWRFRKDEAGMAAQTSSRAGLRRRRAATGE
ncbi:MAG TPA: IclR family transcriptional regulator [Xanthobacteraceae bacterium]|nr:IclR family transcriptional regulator [Xanthobacteraceae bacterium]